MEKLSLLRAINFGGRVAEEEIKELEKYFIETDQWHQMYDGVVDIVYGAKGTGKSALYTLLAKKEDELFDNGVLISPAENVRGATVFNGLIASPPPSEQSFISWWKLYFLTILANTMRSYGINNKQFSALVASLERVGLLPKTASLATLFRGVLNYINGWVNRDVKSIEYGLTIDTDTGDPTVTRKVEFDKADDVNMQKIPVNEYLEIANKALHESDLEIWLLLDRLDVAFSDSRELERNALRALFRCYNDFKQYDSMSLKIFVRDDIWKRISHGGFTEASHITRTTYIRWEPNGLMNLIMRRLLANEVLCKAFSINYDEFVSDFNKQKTFLYSILPDKIDVGKNPDTFDWIVSRVMDGSKICAPREFIHLFEMIKKLQIEKLERGEDGPSGAILFDRSVFKDALRIVSIVRYEQTLLAEYPEYRQYLEKLRAGKAEHNLQTLAQIWGGNEEAAYATAESLVSVGFFDKRGENDNPTYWIPFLYRGALDLLQGKAF